MAEEWRGYQKTYHSLYKTISNFDDHISERYDQMTGSTYMFIMGAQLADGLIAVNDLSEFTDPIRNAILMVTGVSEDDSNENDHDTGGFTTIRLKSH